MVPADAVTILRDVLFVSLLLVATASDLKSRTIPYIVCVLIALTGLIDFSPVRLWGLVLAVPFFLASGAKPKRGGEGDVYLVAAASFVLGLASGAAGLVIGLAAFCLYYLAAAIVRKTKGQKGKSESYPLAPFLSVGFIAAYFIP
jgi:leader peptidase (prepilin peptidase)/N-methyltransferase